MLSVLVNTTPLSYFSAPGERAPCRTCLLCSPLLPTSTTIRPAARLTVGSTIKGCAVMKGALAEAIYFPAQCRKVPPVLIFQPGLCVLYSAVMGGTRRTQPAWTNGVKGERGAVLEHKARVNHVLNQFLFRPIFYPSIFSLFAPFCPFIFLLRFLVCLFIICHLCLLFPPLCAPPFPQHHHHNHQPPLHRSRVHFVPLKFIELASTAEMQKIREAAPLWEMVLHRGWVSAVFLCVCVGVCVVRGGEGELMQRL